MFVFHKIFVLDFKNVKIGKIDLLELIASHNLGED